MKYNIRMNRVELLACTTFIIKKNTVKQKVVLESIFLLLIMAVFYTGMRPEVAGVFRYLLLPLAICIPWLLKVYIVYHSSRVFMENDVEMKLEKGMLSLSSQNVVLYPLRYITGSYTRKKILFLEYCPVKGIRTYFPVPRRIFYGNEEETAFLRELDRQKKEIEAAEQLPTPGPVSSDRKQGYHFTGPTQPAELAHMLAAVDAAERLLTENRKRIRALPFLLAAVLLGVVLFGIKGGFISLIIMILVMLIRANAHTEDSYMKKLSTEISNGKLPGLYQEMQINTDKIICQLNRHICNYSYIRWNILLQVEDVYIFCHSRGVSYAAVAGSFFSTQEEEQQFFRFCEQQGVRRIVCPKKIRKKNYEKQLSLVVCILLLLMAFNQSYL